MSERLARLTANTQQSKEPEFKDGNYDAAPHTSRNADSRGGDCENGQPDHHMTGAVHGQNPSTARPRPHVVTALISKRAELAGQIEHLQRQVRITTIALDHVEETLRIFAPDIDMRTIGPRSVPTAHHAFRGEVSRIVLESLRTAVAPLSTTALTERVMRERGLNMDDKRLCRTMGQRVGACLNHWRRVRGVVRSIPAGPGQVLLWEVVR